ncbi:MAG: hypothetical protein BMS9Abin02_2119 [Anaerolineae bacterium]|nr:MAG: hypothetical protein BMS9Abin02_2119 [Anaerolineae bacterium]
MDEHYLYPDSELRRAWELVCLNQFHDILPGSSIGPVYTESLEQYAEVKRIGDKLRKTALSVIAQFAISDLPTTARKKDSMPLNSTRNSDDLRHLLLVNPTPWSRCDLAFWPGGKIENRAWRKPDGSPVTIQPVDGGLLLDIGCLGPYSLAVLKASLEKAKINRTGPTTTDMTATGATTSTLENNFLLVEFSEEGDITRIYDKETGREVLPSNELANQFQLFEDRPRSPDAWEIDIYYDDKMWLAEPAESITVVENGPLRAAVEIRRNVSHSTLVQRISIAHNSPRLDFDTVIHWREKHMLLKVAFPVAILSPSATYEIQWGNVQRPTHRNTSWDWARFETCAHKWVDLSEGGYGVSLLNDCKYGHDIQENVIRLTLLRATTDPDPEADQGEHHFVYSLLPHAGSWGELTMSEAYMLNDPIFVYEPNPSPEALTQSNENPDLIQRPFVTVDMPNVIVETIKGAENGLGIIVRLYESQRRRGPVTLTTAFPLADAWQTNLLEENQEQLAIDENQLHMTIKPYQIMTLRLLPGDERS